MDFNTKRSADTNDAPEWMLVNKVELFTGIVAFGLAFVALIAFWAVMA